MKTRSITIPVPVEGPADPPEGYTLTEYFVGDIEYMFAGESFARYQLDQAAEYWAYQGISNTSLYAIAKKGDSTLHSWYVPLFTKWLSWVSEKEGDQP